MKATILKKRIIGFCKSIILLTTILLCQDVYSQVTLSQDTLVRQLPEVFITATRTRKSIKEIPARLNSIDTISIENQPAITTDDLLRLIPGANIDRHQGIFSKNSSITLRGLNGTPRTLILIDGVPISKADGGGVNWNRMVNDNIERIEVIKGPVSSVYGGNAMAGVINVITKQPTAKLEGELKTFYGTYNTYGGLLRLGGRLKPTGNSLYYAVNGFYRQGDGYIFMPEKSRDSMDLKAYLWETSASAEVGYRYGSGSYSEVEYSYFNDKRGDGTKIFEPDGGYNRYPTHNLRFTSDNNFGKFNWVLRYFYQDENYLRQSETISEKKGKKYTLYNTDSHRKDQGLWTNVTYKAKHNMDFTFGMDLKRGSVDGRDIYLTSTDILVNKGKLDLLALFTGYEWRPFNKKLTFMAGLRFDADKFYDGSFSILDATTLTEFMTLYPSNFKDETWQSWSPKVGIKYFLNDKSDIYISYSKGFRPGMLDDMCRNGNVSKGFKLANPQLMPEHVHNYEIGGNFRPFKGISIEPTVYYTLGTDFHYFVGNGDSIATGGDNLKPVIQRQNVSSVDVLGAEITFNWQYNKQLYFTANYAFNNSKIRSFDTTKRIAKDLTGKFLMEVPVHQFFAGVFYNSSLLQSSIVYSYNGSQWNDDENTLKASSYNTFDFKIGKSFKAFSANLIIQDLFNTRYYDSKGNISPGRFFMLNLSYHFKK